MRSDFQRGGGDADYGRYDERYNSYGDPRGYRPPSSQISYGNRSSGASSPIYGTDYGNALPAGQRSREPYPAWTQENNTPISKEEIEDIFMDLTAKVQLPARQHAQHVRPPDDAAGFSRLSHVRQPGPSLTIHADYIGPAENAQTSPPLVLCRPSRPRRCRRIRQHEARQGRSPHEKGAQGGQEGGRQCAE